MKITKQRILQIIKEEVEAAQQDDSNTKQKLRKDFLTVAKEFLPDADMVSAEVELTSALMNKILKKAGEAGTSTTQLKRLNDIAGKLLAEEKDVLEETPEGLQSAKINFRTKFRKAKEGGLPTLEAFLKNPPLNKMILNLKKGYTEEEKDKYEKYIKNQLEIVKKEIEILKAKENNPTPEVEERIKAAEEAVEVAQDDLDQEAKATAEPDTSAEEQPQIDIDILKQLVVRFADMLKNNNLLAESIGDIVRMLDIKDKKKFGDLLGKTFNAEELKIIDGIFQSKLKDTFIDLVKKAVAKQATPAEEPKTDEKGVVELPSGDKAIPSQFDELVDEFKRFSDDDDGFMMKTYLKDQDVLLKDLRSALRKFIGLEGFEAALKEAEEPTPEPKPEDKTKGSRESLVKHISRYRRDINDVSKVLAQYLQQAKAGTYKAQPILNKLKVELQNLQDDNVLIVRDLKALAGLKESLLLEEESREEKIAKVRKAYDQIVNLLRPLLNVETVASPTSQQSGEEEASDEQQNEELIIEDIYLEAVTPTEELQSYVTAVKDALTAIDSIKGYFRLTGTFNRPLEEVKNDFVEYIQDYKKTMSDLVSDLKTGVPNPNKAQQYADSFARLAKQIQDDFGISPKELIKTPEVTVAPADADDNTAAVADNPQAEQAAEAEMQETPPDAIMPEPDEVERAKVDVVKFLSDSNKFIKNFTTPLFKILNNQESRDEDKAGEINKLKTEMTKKRMLQEKDEDIGSIVQKAYNVEATIKDVFRNIPTTKFVEEKIAVLQAIKVYYQYRKKFDELQKTEPDEFDKWNNEIEELTTKLADIAGKVVKDSIDDPKIKNALLSQVKDPEDAPEATVIKQQRAARNLERTRELGRTSKIKQVLKSPYGEKDYGKDPTRYMEESKNLLERLIIQELKVLNGKKMVRN